MSDPLERARFEIVRLDSVVKQHDQTIAHYQALRAQALDEQDQVKKFILMYERFTTPANTTEASPSSKHGAVTVTDNLIRIATEINRRGSRARTEEILRIAQEEGISIGGADEQSKKNAIAGTLSRTKDFNARRGHGYWLKSLGAAPDGYSDDEPESVEAPNKSQTSSDPDINDLLQ